MSARPRQRARTRFLVLFVAVVCVAGVAIGGVLLAVPPAATRAIASRPSATGAHPVSRRTARVAAITTAEDRVRPLDRWVPPAGMPRFGRVRSVRIPGPQSHFVARDALVYLPPAALTDAAPRLPVVIAFSGEPGTPSDVIYQGSLDVTMDAIAAQHHGIAPIVVIPDQLGSTCGNPMCVDSPLGNVRSYVMRDVRIWILRHLRVSTARREWTVAGFSEGGTCAITFAARYPSVFGSLVDISGELAPRNGTPAQTIARGFGGSSAAYRRAGPLPLLAAHAPYRSTRALFAVGGLDTTYGPVEPVVERHARKAGMTTSLLVIPGQRHNWTTASIGLAWGMHQLVGWWGL